MKKPKKTPMTMRDALQAYEHTAQDKREDRKGAKQLMKAPVRKTQGRRGG